MNIDIETLKAKDKARREKWTTIHLERLNEKFPELIIDINKCSIVNVTDLHYQVNNEEYYYSSIVEGTYKRNTDYAWQKEFLKEMNHEYKIIETKYHIYLLSDLESCLGARISTFWKSDGTKSKGKRNHIKVYKNNKGLYINLDKKRCYI